MPNNPTFTTLQRLSPLAEFDDDQLRALAKHLNVETASKGEFLIRTGALDEFSLFVLKGEFKEIARDGKVKEVSVGEHEKLNPLAQLRPSMYDIQAAGPLLFLKIDKNLLIEFSQKLEDDEIDDISVEIIEQDAGTGVITFKLYQDLQNDEIKLPSLPQVAQRIQQVFQNDEADADKVAGILMSDPAISGKLIKVANSPVYAGMAQTDTLQAAIVRLGMQTTYKQVMAYAVNELFKGRSAEVVKRMQRIWEHSRKVAAISRILARNTKLFDPDQAMLAGLVHDLGVIVIIDYLQQHSDEISDMEQMEEGIRALRPHITGQLLQKWNFTADMITVAEQCEDWFRNEGEQADLCDLVIVAQYHAQMGSGGMHSMPPISKIPAMGKLNMTPQQSIELLKESSKEISDIEAMLG